MKIRIVTALFDIKRETQGDGRRFEEYLTWFKKTLSLKTDMTIFTEEKTADFVRENRKKDFDTQIVIQRLEDVPFYKNNQIIKKIIESQEYKNKMKDTSRIECYLSEYNVIQYSKFGWLETAVEMNADYDYFIWMDAGCSRFFGNFDLNNTWPNPLKIDKKKLLIQGNSNFVNLFHNLDPELYMWDNNCVVVGTLFGAGKDLIKPIRDSIEQIFEFFLSKNCVNNEQFALAIFAKKYPELMDIKIILNGSHLPIFEFLS